MQCNKLTAHGCSANKADPAQQTGITTQGVVNHYWHIRPSVESQGPALLACYCIPIHIRTSVESQGPALLACYCIPIHVRPSVESQGPALLACYCIPIHVRTNVESQGPALLACYYIPIHYLYMTQYHSKCWCAQGVQSAGSIHAMDTSSLFTVNVRLTKLV